MKPKKPFILYDFKPNKTLSAASRRRLQMPMQEQVRQCEWLWEPSSSSPEQSLGVAVLQRAVLDLITPGVPQKDRESARHWLCGEWGDDFENNYAMSFSRVVQSFSNIDVMEFRSQVLEFVKQAQISPEIADVFRFQRG